MIRVALFGAGRISQVHAAAVAAHPRTFLVAVCGSSPQPAADLAGRYGARSVTDPDAVFNDDTVDAVIIGSPTTTHTDLVAWAVTAGKAVLCEKPLDTEPERVHACWDQIRHLDHTVMIGFNRRFDPSFADAHRRVVDGEIGRVEQLIVISRDPQPPTAAYAATSGGLFRDMTIHDFDMVRFFLGDVTDIHAVGTTLISPELAAAGDIDGAALTLRSESGAVAQITNSRRCAFGYDQRLEVFGSDGMITVGNPLATTTRSYRDRHTHAARAYTSSFPDRYRDSYLAELDHFVHCIDTHTPPAPSFADGLVALRMAIAAETSRRTGAAAAVAPRPLHSDREGR